MKAKELIKKIRAHKGKLLVPVHNANCTLHVAVEKQDMILQLSSYGEDECGYTMIKMDDGMYCIESDHDAE